MDGEEERDATPPNSLNEVLIDAPVSVPGGEENDLYHHSMN